MTFVAPRPLVDDHEADPALRALLADAHAHSAVTNADVARFSARFAPLVGLELLAGAAPGSAAAPVAPSGLEIAGKATIATGKAAAGKVLGMSALKLTAASLAVGASLWFAHDVTRPAQRPALAHVEVAAPQVVAPPPALSVQPGQPSVQEMAAPVEAPVVSKRRDRNIARAHLKGSAAPDELSLIREAQALRSQPSRALALLAQHHQLYPAGLLSQEREVLVVEALLASGRRGDAEARASAFMRAYPGSVHNARLRSMLQQPLAD